jgi:4-hydroxy-tetrahydrodipicolinate synthase
VSEIIRHRPARFAVLSGDDPLTLQIMSDGGDGVVSVTSNAAPALVTQLTHLCSSGDFVSGRLAHHQLSEWTSAAFVESNPIPVKAALAMMGKMANVVRLPLVPLAEKFEPTVRAALVSVGALTA